ncbi:hypothetical protein JOB18_019742 [Solea senegalensis]|uniref:Transmembrane protein family 132 middle domain-containing protein n=1 Tax=Solea senegalensis TaxID=28829 RepID=A0AAV6Q7H0_SOLSE|nr:transmembrane protein 132C [Solea senegalensis]KAG7485849.1 hypothetical protein JOB18_019742 [Solea senegalensis]
MAGAGCCAIGRWGGRGRSMMPPLLLFWIFIAVPPSLLQPTLPLSLPVHMSVAPPPWQFLPLSQAELGPIFSNSSPFSFSQSLFMVPPPVWGPKPRLQASFGPHSVTQLISEVVLPASPSPSASLLSEHVERERDEDGHERFRVRTLFHKWGDSSSRTCITLHAFKETEEHKASCLTQPPLGLCVVTLTLPSGWFEDLHANRSYRETSEWHSSVHARHRVQRRRRGERHHANHHRATLRFRPDVNVDQALKYPRVPIRDQVQLYYSNFDAAAVNTKPTPAECEEEREAQSQRRLFHIKAVTLRAEEEEESSTKDEEEREAACLNRQEEEELSLDSHVVIRSQRGPVLVGRPIRMSVNLRSNFSAEFVVIKLKVKKGLVSMVAQRTLTSDLWVVTLERSQGSRHDVVSIVCHKHSAAKHTRNPALLHQVVCVTVRGVRRSFGVAMTVSANWWVEYSGHSNPSWPRGAAVSVFSFTDRHVVGIAPVTESNRIINTAILTSQPVSLPVIVLAVGHDGNVSDVTSAVTCHSTDENTVKVSADCSAVFVDGSESALGNTCAVVEFHLGGLSGSVCLEVWAPTVPLRVSVSDPVLNAISGWNQLTDDGCLPVYQRSTVQVLTRFTAQDSHSRTVHLLRSSDWFVDVTVLVRDWLRVEDPGVASLHAHNSVIGFRPGKTSLRVVSEQWDGVLGRCDITVSSDPVTPADLSVQVVSGLGMAVTGSPAHTSILTTTVTAYNILYNRHQEASISVWLQFSDDSASLLSAFSDLPFFLRLTSLAETVVVVTPGPDQRVFAQGDGGGPLLRAELLVPTCTGQTITSEGINDGDWDWTDTGGGGGVRVRRLARGSGWVRVNLEPGDERAEEAEEFDFSDTLVEFDGNVYTPDFDNNGNVSKDAYDYKTDERAWNKRGMVSRNNLERAVLTPDQEDRSVYFSPSQENQGEREEDGEDEAEELEVGVGAVLSLLCLSAVLFLANCLPCALRDRRKRRRRSVEGELEGGTADEEEAEDGMMHEEVEKRDSGDGMKQQEDGNNKE